MAQMTAEQLQGLIEAAARAADAASKAAEEMKRMSDSQSSRYGGFTEASKVVRQPDPFGSTGTDAFDQELAIWPDFVLNLKSWLYFADARYEKCLDAVEKDPKTVVNLTGVAADVVLKSNKLYSILSGLLKHKPLRILRQVSERNGFEVYRQLLQLYSPHTKSRAVSLLSAFMSLPGFVSGKTFLEQIQGLERLKEEYRKSSGQEVPDDLALSVLVKCLPKTVQQHIRLSMSDTSTYSTVRAQVLSYEAVSSTWTSNLIHTQLGISDKAASLNGPAPMEIDQVQWRKGKGKSKSKFDQKGKSKGKNKGKFSAPQTKGFKGDSKSGKGKGTGSRISEDVCSYCGKIGHWKRDCHKYKREKGQGKVRVVEEDGTAQTHAASSSTTYVNNSKQQQQGSVNVFQRSSVVIEEVDSPVHDLTAFDECLDDGFSFTGLQSGIHVVSHSDDLAKQPQKYMSAAAMFRMDSMLAFLALEALSQIP